MEEVPNLNKLVLNDEIILIHTSKDGSEKLTIYGSVKNIVDGEVYLDPEYMLPTGVDFESANQEELLHFFKEYIGKGIWGPTRLVYDKSTAKNLEVYRIKH